jgi:hypothetical protein
VGESEQVGVVFESGSIGWRIGRMGELGVPESFAEGLGVSVLDEPQIVDPGRGHRGRAISRSFGVDVLADPERDGLPDRAAVVTDVDVGQVERVERVETSSTL